MLTDLIKSMINEEVSLLDLRNRFWKGLEDFRSLSKFGSMTTPGFELVDGNYVLDIEVEDGAKPSNFDIELDEDGKELSVEYSIKTENTHKFFSCKQTVPFDADTDSIDAVIEDGHLKVTMEQIVFEIDDDDDDTFDEVEDDGPKPVEIKRKNSK